MSPDAHACLVELDAVARELRQFYQYAVAVLPPSPLRSRCRRLARAHAEMVALLAVRLRQPAPAAAMPARGWPGEGVWRGMRLARAGLAAPDPARLSVQMQRVQALLERACRERATGGGDADCRREMAWVLPVLAHCRDLPVPAARVVRYSV